MGVATAAAVPPATTAATYMPTFMYSAPVPHPQPAPPPPPPPPQHQQSAYKNIDSSFDWCSRLCRLFLLIFAIAAFACAYLAMISCAFLEYRILPEYPFKDLGLDSEFAEKFRATPAPTTFPTVSPTARPTSLLTNLTEEDDDDTIEEKPTPPVEGDPEETAFPIATFGLFRFTLPDEPDTCYGYEFESTKDIPTNLRVARAGAVIGSALGALGLLFLLIEFFCIRFICGIPLTVTCFVLAALSWTVAFSLYASENCHPNTLEIYLCELGQGGMFAIIAFCSFLLAAIMTCLVPKSQPIVRKLREMDRNSITDPCCEDNCCLTCCGMIPKIHLKRRHRDDADADEEFQELLTQQMEDDEEEEDVIEIEGHFFKQYHDEKAGVTLQNQYTAAYHRWLECEHDYDKVLDRFKVECTEMKLSWRKVKADIRTADASSSSSAAASSPKHDEELLRIASMLETLRIKCNQSKQVMERIRCDLEEHTNKKSAAPNNNGTPTMQEGGSSSNDKDPPDTFNTGNEDISSLDPASSSSAMRVTFDGDDTELVLNKQESKGDDSKTFFKWNKLGGSDTVLDQGTSKRTAASKDSNIRTSSAYSF